MMLLRGDFSEFSENHFTILIGGNQTLKNFLLKCGIRVPHEPRTHEKFNALYYSNFYDTQFPQQDDNTSRFQRR